MGIPTYKKITLHSHEERMINAQLKQYEFKDAPYILIIHHLVKKEEEALTNIEKYLKENGIHDFPYGVYIISAVENYLGPLNVFKDIANIPKFYKQKDKQLSIKEEQLFNKVILKQQNIYSMQESDYKPTLEEYARNHKVIKNLESELNFINQLDNNIK